MPPAPPLYVSAYTVGNGYEAEAAVLLKTLDAFHLPSEVVPMADRGGWQQNTQAKATFVRVMLAKHPGRPLVWLDADSRVRQYPALFDTLDCDVAFHRRRGELLSGTIYFAPTTGARQLLERWRAECFFFPDVWDQKCLDTILPTVPGLRIGSLPGSYVRIFDGDDMGAEIVIEHMQASRRLKSTA